MTDPTEDLHRYGRWITVIGRALVVLLVLQLALQGLILVGRLVGGH